MFTINIISNDRDQTDNYWLTTRGPSLTYGLRGVAVFAAEVTGAEDDLHSGIYGRMVHEPFVDLIKLLGKLVDTNGVVTIPGIEKQPSAEEVSVPVLPISHSIPTLDY